MTRAALLLAIVLAMTPSVCADDAVHESGNVRLTGAATAPEARQAGALLEALFAALHEHFGKPPPASALPLRLTLDPDPGSFASRRRVLRALTLAYLDALLADNVDRAPTWYREGLAEWFAWHRRTEEGVQFGALDAVAFEHLPADAARRVARRGHDAWAVLDAPRPDPADALAVVAALLGSRVEGVRWAFAAFERSLFESDAVVPVVPIDVRPFWAAFARAWIAETPGVDEVPGGFVADAPTRDAYLRAGREASGIRATVEDVELLEEGDAGVVLGRTGGREGLYVTLTRNGLRVLVHGATSTRVIGTFPLPDGTGPVTLEVVRAADGVKVTMDRDDTQKTYRLGWRALRLDDASLPRHVGLVVAEGRARFVKVRSQ